MPLELNLSAEMLSSIKSINKFNRTTLLCLPMLSGALILKIGSIPQY